MGMVGVDSSVSSFNSTNHTPAEPPMLHHTSDRYQGLECKVEPTNYKNHVL